MVWQKLNTIQCNASFASEFEIYQSSFSLDNWTGSTGQHVRQSCFGHIFADNIGDVDDDDIDNDGDGDNAENSGSGSDGDGDNICGGK